jgi:hypothetical protein
MMNHPGHRLSKAFSDILELARSKDSFASAKSAIVAIAILGIWLTIVIFTATRHEFSRDEVRALSLARAAISPLDLYGLTQYDGHPILWYLLLYIGKSIVDTPVILPVTSIIIAFVAVAVFMFFSPFPFWIRCLFIFSAPLYEYSVMARNYGISMLLLFVSAVLYRNRAKYPFSLAFVLALLANTNVHSAIFACLIAAVWAWDIVVEKKTASVQGRGLSLYLPFAIVFAGVLLCAACTVPKENAIVTSIRHTFSIRDLAYSSFDAVVHPERTFPQVVSKRFPPWVAAGLLCFAAFGLLHRANLLLAALGGQIAFGVLFRLVPYSGEYRHQGLFLVFILFLYWLLIESLNNGAMAKGKHLLFIVGLYVAMPTLVLIGVDRAKNAVWTDIRQEMSSSRAFGAFLNRTGTYRDAVIVPEPDYLLESLPYYAMNRIYLPREHRFGTTVSFTTDSNCRLSLGELLSAARGIKTRYGQSVLIVLGHRDVDKYKSGERKYSYNKVFSWNTNESADFNKSTILVREFKTSYSDENYSVYSIR